VFEMAAPIQSPAKCGTLSVASHNSGTSKTTIHEVLTEKLEYRKLCARWVPKMLTDDHKTKRTCSALKFLTRYAQEGDEFLNSIVTGNETWVVHRNPEPKQQSRRSHGVVQRVGGRLL
jgi:histone-lysine N-methyltransferase SETMAR